MPALLMTDPRKAPKLELQAPSPPPPPPRAAPVEAPRAQPAASPASAGAGPRVPLYAEVPVLDAPPVSEEAQREREKRAEELGERGLTDLDVLQLRNGTVVRLERVGKKRSERQKVLHVERGDGNVELAGFPQYVGLSFLGVSVDETVLWFVNPREGALGRLRLGTSEPTWFAHPIAESGGSLGVLEDGSLLLIGEEGALHQLEVSGSELRERRAWPLPGWTLHYGADGRSLLADTGDEVWVLEVSAEGLKLLGRTKLEFGDDKDLDWVQLVRPYGDGVVLQGATSHVLDAAWFARARAAGASLPYWPEGTEELDFASLSPTPEKDEEEEGSDESESEEQASETAEGSAEAGEEPEEEEVPDAEEEEPEESAPSSPAAVTEFIEAYDKGVELKVEGEHEASVPWFERSAELNPDFGEALHNLGFAQLALGRRDQGRATLARALKLYEARIARLEAEEDLRDGDDTFEREENWLWMAAVHALLEDRAQAAHWMRAAIAQDKSLARRFYEEEDFQALWEDEDFAQEAGVTEALQKKKKKKK